MPSCSDRELNRLEIEGSNTDQDLTDLCPHCLRKGCQQMTKAATSKERVNCAIMQRNFGWNKIGILCLLRTGFCLEFLMCFQKI